MMPRPKGLPIRRENIPEELKWRNQWVGWRWKQIGEKWTKVPYDVKTGRNASSDDPSTWSTYDEVKHEENIGFMFSSDDPYCGVDLDTCLNPETGEIAKTAAGIIRRLGSYAEISPSGTGVKVFMRGTVPGPRRKNPKMNMELYDRLRFFTVTGHKLSAAPAEIRGDQKIIDGLYNWLFPEKDIPEAGNSHKAAAANHDLSDEDILSRAYRAVNGEKFMRLWNGNASEYESHSEADLALCSMLAFWTGPDPERIERMFSESGLARGKWEDRPVYRKKTVEKALSDMTEFYSASIGATIRIGSGKERQIQDTAPLPPSVPVELPEAPEFPVDALPESCRRFVYEGAKAIGVSEDYLGLPVLAALAQGVGASRVVQIKRSWRETSTLFLALVSKPGTKKTPAAKPALAPVWDRDFELGREYAEKKEEFEQEEKEYEIAVKQAKRNEQTPPPPPKAPVREQSVLDDVTVEALVEVIAQNPRGVLVARDELTGWVKAMDQYKGGKGSDKQHWLSLWSSSSIKVNRKGQGGEVTSVKYPSVSLYGSIQPAMLRELGNTAEEGLIERFLFAYPEHRRSRFTYDEISSEAEREYERLIEKLYSYRMYEDVDSEVMMPVPVPMSPEARSLFAVCSDELGAEAEEPGFPHRLRGAFSKLEAYLARLALILSLCRCAETGEVEQVEEEDMEAAYKLIRYFAAHARRVYGETGAATPDDILAGEIKGIIEENGGHWRGTVNELLAALEDRGAEHIPGNDKALGKKVRALGKTSPGLIVEDGWRGKERILKLRLNSDVGLVGLVGAQTEITNKTNKTNKRNKEEHEND
jgi:hypothetical protein